MSAPFISQMRLWWEQARKYRKKVVFLDYANSPEGKPEPAFVHSYANYVGELPGEATPAGRQIRFTVHADTSSARSAAKRRAKIMHCKAVFSLSSALTSSSVQAAQNRPANPTVNTITPVTVLDI